MTFLPPPPGSGPVPPAPPSTFPIPGAPAQGQGPELITNFSFELGQPYNPGGFTTQSTLPGWITVPGSAPLEVVGSPYGGDPYEGGNPPPLVTVEGQHYLDTQASPGRIDIKQVIDTHGATQIQLGETISWQSVGSWPNIQSTPSNETLDFIWNGVVVKHVTMAELTSLQNGGNQFIEFTQIVAANHGSGPGGTLNTFEIKDTSITVGNVGYAIDAVHAHTFV